MGGNQGSVSINDAIRNLLPGLTRNYVVVHQCGSSSGDREFTLSNRVRQTLSKESRGRYIVRSWFSAPEVAFAMRNSRMVISRSGANAVFEIMASKVPSILIPLWFAYKGEQSKNAEFLVKGGSALMIKQTDLSRGSLMSAISAIENNYSDIKNKARSLGRTVNSKADLKLYELVRKVYEEKTK
jgi:UDP-N-acetylglucosamine--N-acetylmuramyl-(pentapeptide) pyrophosphoryl-undecaprenol N-acetylglucosamine transferase